MVWEAWSGAKGKLEIQASPWRAGADTGPHDITATACPRCWESGRRAERELVCKFPFWAFIQEKWVPMLVLDAHKDVHDGVF